VSEVGLAFVDHPSGALAPAAIAQTRMLVSPGEPAQWQDVLGKREPILVICWPGGVFKGRALSDCAKQSLQKRRGRENPVNNSKESKLLNIITRKTIISGFALAFIALSGCGQSEQPKVSNVSNVQLKKINKQVEDINLTIKKLEANQAKALQLQQAQYMAQLENTQLLLQMLGKLSALLPAQPQSKLIPNNGTAKPNG